MAWLAAAPKMAMSTMMCATSAARSPCRVRRMLIAAPKMAASPTPAGPSGMPQDYVRRRKDAASFSDTGQQPSPQQFLTPRIE
jgi:hypothetical protein